MAYFSRNDSAADWIALLDARGACLEGQDYCTAYGATTFGQLMSAIYEDPKWPWEWAVWVLKNMADTLPDNAFEYMFRKAYRSAGRPDADKELEGAALAVVLATHDPRFATLDVTVSRTVRENFEAGVDTSTVTYRT